jgi:RNA methyltransferase, TrmH family
MAPENVARRPERQLAQDRLGHSVKIEKRPKKTQIVSDISTEDMSGRGSKPVHGNRDMLPLVPSTNRHVSRRQHPLVARFRETARRPGNTMLLDGPHLVAEALASGVLVEVAAFHRDGLEDPELSRLSKTRGIVTVVTVSDSVIAAISPTRTPVGVVAIAHRPRVDPSTVVAGDRPLVVIAVDIQDPGNLGALVRSAEAGGATGVIAAGASADPFGWKALRGAMGSAFRLPIARVRETSEALALVRRVSGLRVAAAISCRGVPMSEADLTGALAIVIGSEGSGLADDIVANADLQITIPMAPRVESLNVAVAAALLVYEARRQRG